MNWGKAVPVQLLSMKAVALGLMTHLTPETSSSTETSSASASEGSSVFNSLCCLDFTKPYQPMSEKTLAGLAFGGRKFVSKWFHQYPWLTVCSTMNKVLCYECRYIYRSEMLTFSKNCNPAFTSTGFNNWKKAIQKFNNHESSHAHREAHMKILMIGRPALPEQFSKQIHCTQEGRRKALVIQLSCLCYLLRQGLAVRGHNEDSQGNLRQLVHMLGNISDPCVVDWIRENKYRISSIRRPPSNSSPLL